MSEQVPRGGALNFQASGELAGQQGSGEAAGSGKGANGPLSDQVPKGAPLNLQGSGEVQKAKQPSYAEAVAKGMVMPKPRAVAPAQGRPVSVTVAKHQGGYMFHCTKQTEAECLERMLFGAPARDMQGMKEQITVGSTVFLYNTGTRAAMGPYTATSEPGLGLEEDAWKASGRNFPAQVRVQAQGTAKRQTVVKWVAVKSGAMTQHEVGKGKRWQMQRGTVMETKQVRSGSSARPVQEQSGQSKGVIQRSKSVKGQDGQLHQLPTPKTAGSTAAGVGSKQTGDMARASSGQGQRRVGHMDKTVPKGKQPTVAQREFPAPKPKQGCIGTLQGEAKELTHKGGRAKHQEQAGGH